MNHLHRELAPVTDVAWRTVDDEAARALRNYLAARRLIDVSGPHGWELSAVDTGRLTAEPASAARDDVAVAQRAVQPLVELRREFVVVRSELDAIDRGSDAVDLDSVVEAARVVALTEDRAVFHGLPAAGIVGMAEASPHDAVTIEEDYDEYPRFAARAVASLHDAGVDGPYGIALGTRCYTGVIETTHGGYPVLEHLRLILGGPVVWAPAVDGAVVVSLRGGDFVLTVGQDLSIGYVSHAAGDVTFALEETMTFRATGPEAAVALVHGS